MGRKPCRFKSEYGLLTAYRFHLEEEEALPLAFQRCRIFFASTCIGQKNTHVHMPCRFKSEYGLFVVVANMLHIYGLLLLYRFYLEEEEALPLAFQRCTYFFCGKHLHRTKKTQKQHASLSTHTHTHAHVNRGDSNRNGLLFVVFAKMLSLNTEMLNVPEILSRAKRCTCMRGWVRVLFVCVYACAARARACVCVFSMRNKKTRLAAF